MQINKFRLRLLMTLAGLAAAVAFVGLSSGQASADTRCSAANGSQVERVQGKSGCGAKAGPNSRADSEDRSGAGTAVAIAANRGQARALNLQPGSTALAGANTGGNAYSVTTGPKALALAQATRGGTSVAIGGWGGQAMVGPAGAVCSGGFAAAVNTTTGKMCLHSGSIDYRN
ncbi:hypothetical protein QSJ18_09390 [Gordonia sp. ABSL1-1]|uniref:DUF6764 family protein n=1 Tax=Gordonia sp. ABSL1-1 TaxID=3053923 RepID=UPI002573CF80|nr:DUF6764 family protein [Gordonia sp. ABSL1-1]MDL9936952.1 hypothetical protein [Gordonia sp. ABSL1-1]